MKILVLNSGSSSLKFQLFNQEDLSVAASGLIEEIGDAASPARLDVFDGQGGKTTIRRNGPVSEHRQALALMGEMLRESGVMTGVAELGGIGHRVVHGGESFHDPVLIDSKVIAAIDDLIPLAPLHNPANLVGIRVAREHAPDIPQVAVFDTAFHQTIPEHGYLYALPYRLYEENRVRRYGFHGTSHAYVSRQAADHLGKPLEELNLITLHLGNGASAAAVQGGRCIATSMGMTPLEGLIMGTRCGDLDPAICFYLARETGMEIKELDNLLNKQSGLKGICGENDMRTITESAAAGSRQAELALTMFCYRIKKYMGSYMAALGGVDCIVFTGGIGENAAGVRKRCCEGLERLGIVLDHAANEARGEGIMEIHAPGSAVRLLVVPTDEELEIATQTRRVIAGLQG
jgi:acetate kinase